MSFPPGYQVRPKSANCTPKQEKKHPHHFDMRIPLPPLPPSPPPPKSQPGLSYWPETIDCSPANKQAPADKPVLYQKQNKMYLTF